MTIVYIVCQIEWVKILLWTDGLARNVKKAESISNDADKQALLKQVALVDVLDGWKDGILTIGTLGFDPLKSYQQNEYFILESEEEEEDEEREEEEEEGKQGQYSMDDDDDDYENVEDEEVNPLIFTTFEHNFEDIGSNFEANAVKSDVIMTVDGVTLAPIKTNSSIPEIDQRKRKGERITLAELFLADSDMKKKPNSGQTELYSGKKPIVRAKNGLSFARKFIPHVRDDSRPIKKFHQVSNTLQMCVVHIHE